LFEKSQQILAGPDWGENKESPVERDTHIAASGWDNQITEATAQNTKAPCSRHLATTPHNAFVKHHIPRCVYGQMLPSYQAVQ
jgi:pyrimidine deaminase RibD-like protein